MLSPKRVKFRKMFKGRMTGTAYRGSEVSFGHYGLQAQEPGWVSNRQIEAGRVAISRSIKRGGKIWIPISPDKPTPKKPAGPRGGPPRPAHAGRVPIRRSIKRGGKIWIRIFPDKPITKKRAETRMGKGKGSPEAWGAVGKPGRLVFGRGR